MTPAERHARVKELFIEVCALPPSERAAFLNGAPVDPPIRSELHALLAHYNDEPSPPLASGSLYADRYRIVSLIGRGGMGEVYRAEDTRLGVPVALKRLHHGGSAVIDEVRIARDITHYAVCRVFDVGETDGEWFFTMEYVDGEDLASLLRRIGRLSTDKVSEIGRQLCAALAAAHARGILHRDLKPANILIDSRGRVRLTDFGIAVSAGRSASAAGTPAYMSPEQIGGLPLSPASDLYSAGIVLYELITGRPPFAAASLAELLDLQRVATPAPPSDTIPDIDPRLERAILHALKKDPEDRPRSALEWVGELPGGDPLQIAADAGVTPPADLVAASTSEGLSLRVALTLLLSALALMVLCIAVNQKAVNPGAFGFESPPAVLAAHARDVAGRLSFPLKNMQTGFLGNAAGVGPRNALLFWWRSESNGEPLPFTKRVLMPGEDLDAEDTMLGVSRALHVLVFDSGGRLVYARSSLVDLRNHRDVLQHESAAGPAALTEHEFATNRSDIIGGMAATTEARGDVSAVVLMVLLLIATPLAIRNVRGGRTDRSRARRLAQIVGVMLLISAAILGYRVSYPLHETSMLPNGRLIGAALLSLFAWVAYAGLEPYMRRRWPQTLIGSTRLLSGRLADPHIAREILIGVTGGTCLAVGQGLIRLVSNSSERASDLTALVLSQFTIASELRRLLALFFEAVPESVLGGVIWLLLLVFLRASLRREWLAAAAFTVVIAMNTLYAGSYSLSWWRLGPAVAVGIVSLLLLRQGLLAFATALFVKSLIAHVPLTTHGESWFADAGYTVLIVIAFLATAALIVTTHRHVRATIA